MPVSKPEAGFFFVQQYMSSFKLIGNNRRIKIMKKRKIILAMLLCAAMTTGSVLPVLGEDLAAEADVQDVTENEAFDESEEADFAEFTDQEEVTSDVLDGAFTAYPEEAAPIAEDAENPGPVAAQGYYTFDFWRKQMFFAKIFKIL